jgi:hypothetical protein
MADISDVTALFVQIASAACYTAGTGQPSVAGVDVYVSEGFPLPGQLDPDIKAGKAAVTIYCAVGGPQNVDQYLPRQEVIAAPVLGLTLTVDDDTESLTLAGTPAAGEFVTVLLNRKVSFASAQTTVGAILTDLAAQAASAFPQVAVVGSTINFPGAYALTARSGATGLVGEILHREKSLVTVTVWTATPLARSIIASALDIAFKKSIRVTFPDTSQGFVRYSTTRISDERENMSIYRRDLVYEVEYSTMDIYPGVAITGVEATVSNDQQVALVVILGSENP